MNELLQKAYFSDSVLKKKAHYHDCHQIILILKGNVQFCINNAIYQARSGNVIIISRYENHSVNVLSNNYERYVLQINPKVNNIENRVYSLLLNRPEGFCNAIDVSNQLLEFKNIFCRIIDEYSLQNKLSDDMQQLLINQLLIMIYRQLPDAPHFDEMIYAVQRRFENNCSEQYTLGALAKQNNISASSLSHQFKKLTGSSVMGYLTSCRIASAKHYLTATNLDIGEIVEKCGFSDNSNFSRTFKKLNGISPSEFRKKYKA